MRAALASGRIEPDQVDILNTHATSTPSGDEVECAAVREVFRDSPSVLINNTKSYIGHAMGAAGALERTFGELRSAGSTNAMQGDLMGFDEFNGLIGLAERYDHDEQYKA